jgi:hypothetical protein
MGDGYNFQQLPFPLARQIRQERRSRLQEPLTVGEDQRHYDHRKSRPEDSPMGRAMPFLHVSVVATEFSSGASTCPVHSDCQAASAARQVNGTLGPRHLCNP